MSAVWIVHRSLEALERMPEMSRPGPAPDRSIVVDAMAQFIRFAQAVPGMPTLWFDGRQEQLTDGTRLLQALRQAGHARPVACIWRAEVREAPAGSLPFSAEQAGRVGSEARLITFERALEASHANLLDHSWAVPGARFNPHAYGWAVPDVGLLPDWSTWINTLQALSAKLPPLRAINGRQPAFR